MIKVNNELSINPAHVASLRFDRRHYVNGPGDTVLVIYMDDGAEHRVRHEPHLLGGTDAYAVEKAIEAAFAKAEDDPLNEAAYNLYASWSCGEPTTDRQFRALGKALGMKADPA